jgi:Na+/H+ antiporter NhaA
MNTVSQFVNYGIEVVSRVHDNFIASQDPHVMLRTGIVLLLLGHVGKHMGVWTLALTLFISLFTVPYILLQYASTLNTAYSAMLSIVKSNVKAMGWTRKQQAAVFLLVMSLLWVWSTWFYRFIGILIGAMTIRCNLKPAEIDAIRQHAAPLTTGVKKRAARLSIAANDFAQRTLGTKLHFK